MVCNFTAVLPGHLSFRQNWRPQELQGQADFKKYFPDHQPDVKIAAYSRYRVKVFFKWRKKMTSLDATVDTDSVLAARILQNVKILRADAAWAAAF
ncbi:MULTISPECIES: hypothetical protein [unclassified Desulfovibrio]|uniref:hypothetical protein n=1 Tax=unclassified Desulfovibrio TaxID=2593640 RepID=UPI000F5DEA9F|nr:MULTISPECIES: hypothetical protein [unclassified Desulfovibrio]RRD70867.1 hypothetical protein EII24_05440 [Desulfovibrio sp. OH1209_COT-279]RRD87255.1 hypothetical protein EII23_05440 [Desulfovibrio sp. OH1186_COT-070]